MATDHLVKFINSKTGKGFIDGYRTAARAKEVVEQFHRANTRSDTGMTAHYLGRRSKYDAQRFSAPEPNPFH
jgi:hypothetical protein